MYYRDEFGLHPGIPTEMKGYYKIDFNVTLNTHPVEPNFADRGLMWTHKPQAMVRKKEQSPIMHFTCNDLTPDEEGPVDIISDASVHVQQKEGAVTWCAVNESDQVQSVDHPLKYMMQDTRTERRC